MYLRMSRYELHSMLYIQVAIRDMPQFSFLVIPYDQSHLPLSLNCYSGTKICNYNIVTYVNELEVAYSVHIWRGLWGLCARSTVRGRELITKN